MTGHGQAIVQDEKVRVLAEVRTVNNRFLKTHIHCDLDVNRQAQLENLLKENISRGNVNLKVVYERLNQPSKLQINAAVVRSYWLQLAEIAGNSQHVNVESVLHLPGVVSESLTEDDSDVWPLVEQAVIEALQQLKQMRDQEGVAMRTDILKNCEGIRTELDKIRQLAPSVVENYGMRMMERIKALLEKHQVEPQSVELIREVGVFAERVDISEEIVRLSSHILQFRDFCDESESSGRKLDFLVQEMLRETNTIGSKASDAEIANSVVNIKTNIERIREMVQNVE
jgi:uncharacterized protein (TIGR00255 family)